ncbi:MAG: hypothetical protein ABH829_02530 [archaeon]
MIDAKKMRKAHRLAGVFSTLLAAGCTGVRTIGFPGVETLQMEMLKVAALLGFMFAFPKVAKNFSLMPETAAACLKKQFEGE